MNPEQLFDQFFTVVPLLILKIFSVVILAMHTLFAIVLLRQVRLMTRVLEVRTSGVIFTIGVVHLFASLGVLLWAIFFL